MGSIFLTGLAQSCRSIGAIVHEEPGWQTRSRSSGGFNSGLPSHVMCHHTASNPSSDGQSDVNYMCYGSENKPVANLYLSRSGEIWVMAAGATNTNGSGTCPHCGTTDNMNTKAIGIEAANNGIGELWPMVQQDVYVELVRRLCSDYGIPNPAIIAHFEYAPTRKIDPAGQSNYASGSNKWNMNLFRSDVGGASPGPGPSPGPPSKYKGADVAIAIQSSDGTPEQKAAIFAYQPGVAIGWLVQQTDVDIGRVTGTLVFDGGGNPLKNLNAAAIQDRINRYWAGGVVPVGWRQPAAGTT